MRLAQPNVLTFPSASHASPAADVLLGPSPAIARVWSQLRRVAPYFRTALITGERGTGHDAVAHALHSLSPRAQSTLHILTAVDAEHQLTGSILPRFDSGTVFFPDVDRLSTPAQNGLLRLLRLRRPHQVVIIAASTTELRPLVSAGGFSSVLASSLSALQIQLPALRERSEDIPALATHLLAHEARQLSLEPTPLASSLLDSLTAHPWPGNLDQLHTVLRRMLHEHAPADPESLDTLLLTTPEAASAPRPEPTQLLKLEEVVQQHIRGVLLACNGNKLRAAEILGISRSTLYRMLDSGNAAGFTLPQAV